ncbi:MAG: phytase [Pseudomonadota bacterium]
MASDIRVASFNASMNRSVEGGLITDLTTQDDSQAQSIAEIVQKTDADIILLNEFDFDADGEAARLFSENYLSIGQNGADPIDYPYVYVAPSNTGVLSGFDLNNDGVTATEEDNGSFTYANDSQGFGQFEGQFGFVIYSKYPIETDDVRTFQEFLWKDMPDNLLTNGEGEPPLNEFYSAEEIEVLRLSSKNHVDLPVNVDGEIVHILAAHPTPPVFDGDEDRNGKRNHDEIRFWADYVQGADYIYDDNGLTGGLAEGARFVIVGDYNADPFDGDSFDGAINQLLENPLVQGSATDDAITPDGPGGTEQAIVQAGDNENHLGNPAFDTADFGFAGFADDGTANPDGAPGNLRVDYALPSTAGLIYRDGAVFWPESTDPDFALTSFPTSDHRLVYADLTITDQDRRVVNDVEFLFNTEIDSGTTFEETIIGGLSGVVYNPTTGTYFAVSDDRNAPRYYELDYDFTTGEVDFLNVVSLENADGSSFADVVPDPEGIAIGPDGTFYISSERDLNGLPAVYTSSDGVAVDGALPVSDKFLPDTDGTKGVRNNLGFESLTITPDQTTLYIATESALVQDGERADLETGSAARIVKYDVATGEAVAEFIYEVDPIATEPDPVDGFADSGLVELLAIDNQGTLLALERSFSVGAEGEDRGYTGKLYLVRTLGATNVIDAESFETSIEDGELEINVDEIAQKELLVDLGDLGIVVDNIEGMTLGPVLEDGRQSLLIVSDDNFSAFGPQANQFLSLALDLGEIPTITPILETPDELRYPGPEPIVIAHRGASADRPEHTLEAYQLAIDNGADFIEPDLVSTSDGVLVARHEPWLATVETDETGEVVLDDEGNPVITFASANVADLPEFADRLTTKNIGFSSDGLFGSVTGWFVEDFTLEELKTLRAVEDQPDVRPQSAAFDGQFEIPTLQEIIELIQAHEEATGEEIGIYPETKEPSYFDSIGLSLEEPLIQTFIDTGFTDPDRIFIQSFEIANLLDLQENVMPAAGVDFPLVQLLFNAPTFATYDLVEEALTGGDFSRYASLGFDASTVSGDLYTPEGLQRLADVYAEGIGPSLSLVFNDDLTQTDLVANADAAGLLIHAYTHRDENTVGDLTAEETYELYLSSGIDGLFTDNSDTGRAVTDSIWGNGGVDPDDPAIWENPDDPAASLVITAMKEGGLRVYDLQGQELSRLEPEGIRYNNVEVIADFNGRPVAVVSDRANDTVAIFDISADGTLTEVTSPNIPASIFGVDDGEATAYGLAAYSDESADVIWITQADGANLAQLRLTEDETGVGYELVKTVTLPVADGDDPTDYQSEGIAIDAETGIGYVGVEGELGLLSFDGTFGGSDGFNTIADFDTGFFEADIEGVAIHYEEDGEGLIIVSSQGDATFAVFDRASTEYLGSFAIRGEGDIDGVEESDGLAIFSGSLPGWENGLLVTQDGSNEPVVVFGDPEDGELQNFNVNFKYTDLGDVLELFDSGEPEPVADYTLELLHFADQEAGIPALDDIPNFSAVLNALREEDLGDDGVADNTLTLSSGDAILPGVFYSASEEVFGAAGRGDILIQNELGVQAIALGNHEFDAGTEDLAGLIAAADGYDGALFPYLSANLDVSTDDFLAPLEVEGGQAPQSNTITSSVILSTADGEQVGVVGATTPTLGTISSPGGVTILPEDFDGDPTDEQLEALAAEIQDEVDALLAGNPDLNKVILLSHMQQLDIERALAELLTDVDIIVGGGSNTRLFDENDVPRAGDSVQGDYPEFITNAGGTTTALVNTDGNYKYVGRLVLDFDEDGNVIADSYDADVSGAYATDDAGVAALGAEDLADEEIVEIVDALREEIVANESNVFGLSDVYLNGVRGSVRTEETNLGNLTADANLAAAQEADPTVLVSIKNGGGIRDDIGVTFVQGDGTVVEAPTEAVFDADGNEVKPEGGISQTDIANALSFNNNLTLLTLTREELVAVLEHGIAASSLDDSNTQGRFPQVSGVQFSFDLERDPGDRIISAAITDEEGNDLDVLVENGELQGDASATVRIVTLGFLADGGDGFPFPAGDAVERVDLDEVESFTGGATFAADGTEQDAFAEYLLANFATEATAFDTADVGRDQDTRLQNLAFTEDTVIDGSTEPTIIQGTDAAKETLVGSAEEEIILGGVGNNRVFAGAGDDRIDTGAGSDWNVFGGAGADTFVFGIGSDNMRVLDFTDGEDLIELTEGLTFDDLTLVFSDASGATNIFTDEGDRLILRNVDIADLTADDFIFV